MGCNRFRLGWHYLKAGIVGGMYKRANGLISRETY